MRRSLSPETRRALYPGRVLLLPAILLALLVGLPWIMDLVEHELPPTTFHYLREVVDSSITLLLGIWILTLIRREQSVAREHLGELSLEHWGKVDVRVQHSEVGEGAQEHMTDPPGHEEAASIGRRTLMARTWN